MLKLFLAMCFGAFIGVCFMALFISGKQADERMKKAKDKRPEDGD